MPVVFTHTNCVSATAPDPSSLILTMQTVAIPEAASYSPTKKYRGLFKPVTGTTYKAAW